MTVATNFMVNSENRPYLEVPGLAGVSIKPMNVKEETTIWSAVMRIEAGASLPARRNNSLCEVFVVRGSATFAGGQAFQNGDYVREENGDFDKITARSELVVFFTNHGKCAFLDEEGNILLEMDHKTRIDQFKPAS